MDIERQAQVVKQRPSDREQVAHSRRLAVGQRTLEAFAQRTLEGAERLTKGAVASELFAAAAEAYEDPLDLDAKKALGLFQRALKARPECRAASQGLRRLARIDSDGRGSVELIEYELNNAAPDEVPALRLELARALLYQVDQPRKALMLLEDLEAERKALPGQPANAWMGMPTFLLWEEALWATGQWKRYEELLREAIAHQDADAPMSRSLEARLLLLYEHILPDRKQADIVLEHLNGLLPLEPQRLTLTLQKHARDAQPKASAALLQNALSAPACASRATMYRLMLADLLRRELGDDDGAAQVLKAGVDAKDETHAPVDPLLLFALVDVQRARGDVPALIDALGMCLDVLERPIERAHALYQIGVLLLESLSMGEDAEAMLHEALKEYPAHGPSLQLLGRRIIERGDWAALAAIQSRALEVSEDAGRWRAHLELAQLFEYRLQQPADAFAHYRAALLLGNPCGAVALEGAARTAHALALWTELTEVYVAAEQATTENTQRVYLLERIAHIADDHLSDAATAIKALEALRSIEPQHANAIATLSRLYARQGMREALITLNDEVLDWTEAPNARAALLCSNAELHLLLQQRVQAEQCYRSAIASLTTYLPAVTGLRQMLAIEGRWEALLTLLLDQARALGDEDMKAALQMWQEAAGILEHLDRRAEAVELHWRCLRANPADALSRDHLLRHFTAIEDWAQVAALLEAGAEHASSPQAAASALTKLSHLRQTRLSDLDGAFDALRRAYLSCPDAPALLHLWLKLARQMDRLDEVQRTLTSVSGQATQPLAKNELLGALATLSLRQTHDPLTAAGFLQMSEGLEPGNLLGGVLLSMSHARSSRWPDRASLALTTTNGDAERRHGLEASLVLGVPAPLEAASHRELNALADAPALDAERCWLMCPPSRRPPHHHMPNPLRHTLTRNSQALRRWSTMKALRAGLCTEPASILLPTGADHSLSLQADLELLAAFYDQTRQWDMLLQVLAAQEEAAQSPAERVRLCIERCKVFDQLGRHAETLQAVHNTFQLCAFDDPSRDTLYDRLEESGDWEVLVREIRRQLMHIEDPIKQSALWLRLSRVLERGPRDLDEALRALDAAYRCYPSDGSLLSEIARVAEVLGETPIARRALDDYLVYHRPDIEVELDLSSRLVRLHMEHPGGDPKRVLAWLEDLVSRSCDEPRALRAMAEAHARGGSPLVACDVLGRLLREPYRPADVSLWLMLAALYGGPLNDPMRAERLYWDLMATFPSDDSIWNEINAFYQSADGRQRLLEQLTILLGRAPERGFTAEQQRVFLARQAHILGDELGRWREAQDVLHKALGLDEQPTNDLAKQHAYALCHTPGDIAQAYDALCELLVKDPFQPDILRQALSLCEGVEAFDRARILRQFARFFLPDQNLHAEDEGIRPKVMPGRPLETAALTARLLFPNLRGGLYEVLHEALPIIEHVERDHLPDVEALGGKRLKGNPELASLFDQVGSFLGLGSVKVFLTNDESPEPVVLATPPSLCIPGARWESLQQAEHRHWAGYAAGVLWTGLAPLVYLDGRNIWQILDAVFYVQTGKGLGINGQKTAYTLETAEKVRSPWLRRSRKAVSELLMGSIEATSVDMSHLWGEWLQATGDRCGLIFSGDIESSVRALLTGQGWSGEDLNAASMTKHLEHNERLRHMLRFALSEDYLHLRHAAGLASRPSILS